MSAGRPYPGMEHWLPLFHERLVPITDYLAAGWLVGFDHLVEAALESRYETIGEHYAARKRPPEAARAMGAAPYRALPPDQLYLSEQALSELLDERERFDLVPFAAPTDLAPDAALDLGGRRARTSRRSGRARMSICSMRSPHQLRLELAAGKRV